MLDSILTDPHRAGPLNDFKRGHSPDTIFSGITSAFLPSAVHRKPRTQKCFLDKNLPVISARPLFGRGFGALFWGESGIKF